MNVDRNRTRDAASGLAIGWRLLRLDAFAREQGHCFTVVLPRWVPRGDDNERPSASRAILFEDGRQLGPAHGVHDRIRETGGGIYSHWGNQLFFSTSDNSDARRNRRVYHLLIAEETPVDSARQRLLDLVELFRPGMAEEEAFALAESLFYAVYERSKVSEFGRICCTDSGFIAEYERFCGTNYRSLDRKYAVYRMVGALSHVPGDTAECGVYTGGTSYFIAKANRELGVPRQHHLFDSFEGLSRPVAADGSYWRAGGLRAEEAVARANLAEFSSMNFHKGWIPARFGEVADRRFSFVHIDVDLLEPTRASVEFFYPRVSAGGMIVCDDYGFWTCPGARKAMDDFFADKPERIIDLPTGQGLVIKQ